MKILITYSSQSGNTKKLAETAFEHLEGDKEIVSIDNAPSADQYNLVVLGFWFQAGKPDPKSAKYLEACGSNANLFLMATHGAAKGSDHAKAGMAAAVELTNGSKIMGTFSCQGQVNPKVLEKVRQKEHPPVWIDDTDEAVGHPDEDDIRDLKALLDRL